MKTKFAKIAARRSTPYVKQKISKLMQYYLFEPNDKNTRAAVRRQLATLFKEWEVADYCIICDSTNNDPAVIGSGGLVVDVAIKFTEADPFVHYQIRIGAEPVPLNNAVDFLSN